MIATLKRILRENRSLHRMSFALARAAATAPLRQLNPLKPESWEFSGFSQHGEDGLLDFITTQLLEPNRYFVEIGCSDGLENNTTWLALCRNYSGLMIDGGETQLRWCRHLLAHQNYGLNFMHLFVSLESIPSLRREVRFPDPDVFSVDIDGNDYHIVSALLESGFLPRVWILEYNSAFGPERAVTIPYEPNFRVSGMEDGSDLYYGCSIAAWRKLLSRFGYHFLTVETRGVNALFVNPSAVEKEWLDGCSGDAFRDNCSHVRAYGSDWRAHFELIPKRTVIEV